MRKRPSLLPVVVIVAAIGGFWAWHGQHPREKLGAGTPLDQTHSQINVLSPTEEATPLPTNTSSSAIIGEPGASQAQAAAAPIIMTSATVILSPTVQAAASNPQLDHLQLGVLLALAAQQYASGGDAALPTLKGAEQLATGPLKQKISTLRSATPDNGPITPALLLVEAQRVRTLGAPEGSEENPKVEPTGWLSRLVQVKTIEPKPTMSWGRAFNAAQLQLAANNPAGAAAQLSEAPLNADKRLDDLRTALTDYIKQNDALAAVLSGYAAHE